VLAIGVIGVAALHWIAFYQPYVARKAGQILPYIEKIYDNERILPRDFVPRFDSQAMSSRPEYWLKAVALFKTSPWIGIGLGQFNVRSGLGWVTNVNNIYLNILTECGVIVFLVLSYVLIKFLWNRRGIQIFPVLMMLVVIGLFDNQYDHSLSWNLTVAWMLAYGEKEGGSAVTS
jgi:O-antigen ligase